MDLLYRVELDGDEVLSSQLRDAYTALCTMAFTMTTTAFQETSHHHRSNQFDKQSIHDTPIP